MMSEPRMSELAGVSPQTPQPTPPAPRPTPGNYHPALQALIDNAPERLYNDKAEEELEPHIEQHPEPDEPGGGGLGVWLALIPVLVVGLFAVWQKYRPAAAPEPEPEPDIPFTDPYLDWEEELRQGGHI